ncbi:hypothetical protein LCGC14_1685890 [marine sediment metagenome]|uniref:Uncharacterized protein n=1 Tax=marine sediment metagenome TaxID=412755 RepID=A0A0F9HMM3_9ZZZZ
MKKLISMKVDVDLLKEGKKIARETKRSFTQLVTDLLMKQVERYNRKNEK